MHYTTAAEAVKLIRSNDSVYIQGSTSIPEVLVRAMTDRAAELTDVTLYSGFAVGRADAPYCRPEYKDTFLVNSLFVANNIRRWLAQGYGQSTPAFLGEIPGLFRDGTLPVDVAILNLSRPNEEGYCSFGVSADLAVSAGLTLAAVVLRPGSCAVIPLAGLRIISYFSYLFCFVSQINILTFSRGDSTITKTHPCYAGCSVWHG